MWVPTVGDAERTIPAGYGSESMTVMHLPDVVDMMMGIAGDFDPHAIVEAMKAAKKKQQEPGGWLQMIEES